MATSGFSTKTSPVPNTTGCGICRETLTNPKRLSCLHTFCLHCLDTHITKTPSWSEPACPLCATKISIPTGGLADLPDNTFVLTLVELDRIRRGPTKDQICEPCAEDSSENADSMNEGVAVVQATVFCVDCDQRLCEHCAKAHRKLRLTKDHQVFWLGSSESEAIADIWKKRVPNCKCSPGTPVIAYCPRCSLTLCKTCATASHRDHQCQILRNEIEKIRKVMGTEIGVVSENIKTWRLKEQNLRDEKKQFLENVNSTRMAVKTKADELIQLIKDQKDKMLAQLEKVKTDSSGEFDDVGDEIDATIAKMEIFRNFSTELYERGDISQILGLRNTLSSRAQELREIVSEKKVQLVRTMFVPATEHQRLVGHVSVDVKNHPPLNVFL